MASKPTDLGSDTPIEFEKKKQVLLDASQIKTFKALQNRNQAPSFGSTIRIAKLGLYKKQFYSKEMTSKTKHSGG